MISLKSVTAAIEREQIRNRDNYLDSQSHDFCICHQELLLNSDQLEMTLVFNCLLLTDDYKVIRDTFPVSCGKDASISQLAKAISENPFVPSLHYPDVTLWKPLSYFPVDPPGDIPDRVKNLHLGSDDGDCGAQKLDKESRLELYFPSEKLPDTRVHLIVQLPEDPRSVTGKRKYEDEHVGNPRMAKLRESAMTWYPPVPTGEMSSTKSGKCPAMEEDRILNDRPTVDAQVTPIALLYRPFGQFLDRLNEYPQVDDSIDLWRFECAVWAFTIAMSCHYESETRRKVAALTHLNDIFSAYKPSLPAILWEPNSGGEYTNRAANVMETVVQIGTELGSGDDDPEARLTTTYFTQFKDNDSDRRRREGLYDRFLFPVLGISINGRAGHSHSV